MKIKTSLFWHLHPCRYRICACHVNSLPYASSSSS